MLTSDYFTRLKSLVASNGIAVTLVVSGMLGFFVGFLAQPTWQAVLETSQVVAGVVPYPKGNTFYIYHTKAWTILHQICALFLAAGVSERVLSLFISGVLGMISFQALSLCVYAFSRNPFLAIASCPLIYVTRAVELESIYPVVLLGHGFTYGIFGLSYSFLILALLGVGQMRWAVFLLGLAPAVHPSMAFFLWIGVGVCILWKPDDFRVQLRGALPFFAAGCLLSALSLGVHLLTVYDPVHVSREVTDRYLRMFHQFWDAHRKPVNLESSGLAVNIGMLFLAYIWLIFFKRDIPQHAQFLLRAFVIFPIIGVVSACLSQVSPETLPSILVTLMPSRVMNFAIFGFGAFLIGILGAEKKDFWLNVLMAVFMLLLFASWPLGSRIPIHVLSVLGGYTSVVLPGILQSALFFALVLFLVYASSRFTRKYFFNRTGFMKVEMTMICLLLGVAMLASFPFSYRMSLTCGIVAAYLRFSQFPPPRLFENRKWLYRLPRTITVICLLLFFFKAGEIALNAARRPKHNLKDWTNDGFWAKTAGRPGVLLTCSDMGFVQLRSRRPVLLNGNALDTLTYAPESGPAMDVILKDVYGVDLFHPPKEAFRTAAIPNEMGKTLWETRTREDWIKIGKAHGVNDVITYADWKLQLPVIARSAEHVLYEIQ